MLWPYTMDAGIPQVGRPLPFHRGNGWPQGAACSFEQLRHAPHPEHGL